MKNFYVLLIALLLPFSILFATDNVHHVSGMVYENPGTPVPGHQVNIEIPPSNIFDGYFNEVFTNEGGFYVDEILLPENVTQGEIFLSTIDCNGEMITEMFLFSPEMMEIEHDFILCDEPYPDCVASFIWEPLEGNSIQFINTSIPENANSIWEFGDGTTSDDHSPVHEYAEQGVYEVCLMIYNDELNCEDEFCMEVFVGNNTGCEAFFEWVPAPNNPMAIGFFNGSTGGEELEYLWSFGDGETSGEMNPTHTYDEPGVYEVCLEISGEGCEDDYCTEVFVDEWPGECMAEFEFDVYEDNTVQFFNFSFPPDSEYLWDFGDGETSGEFEPLHTYAESGEYEVCLTIWSSEFNCEDQTCMEVFIGGGGECVAFFEWAPAPNNPMVIGFFNGSTGGEELEYLWNFGDGETSGEMNPTHTYDEPGVYEVCLEISGEGCEDDYCAEVFVDEWPGECMAEFEFDIYEDNTVQFFNFSFPPDSEYLWDFGDGETSGEFEPLHTYAESGEYEVCLTIWSSEFNCEDQTCMEVFIGGGGECDAYYTWWPTDVPHTIQFMDYSWIENGQYQWEFGDGTTATEPNPTHTYQQPGIYEVCLVVYNNECEDVYCEAVIVEGNGGGGDCQAEFEWVQLEGNQIQFFNISDPYEADFYWEFGDGNGYYEHSPVHLFTEPGVYEVCLSMITVDGCADAICHEVIVEGNGGGELNAFFEITTNPEEPLKLKFWDGSSGNPQEWFWEFGDGATSNEQNPEHTYEQGGSYIICLTVFSGDQVDNYCTGVEINEAYFSGIEDLNASNFRVYPNPVRSEVFIDMNFDKPQSIEISIFNLLMQELETAKTSQVITGEQTLSIPVSNLENGIYVLGIKTGTDYYTEKIIISK